MSSVAFRHIVCAIILLLSLPWPAFSESSKQVLILNSYHHGFKWTDEQSSSVITELGNSGIPIKYYIEYMGTKWAYDKEYLERLPELYHFKFKAISFDLIIATDDDALNFLLKYRDDLFGKIPVVFCGVNWFDKSRLKGRTGYTGVNEDADIATNIDLMLRLHPKAKNIYMVVDLTTTGRIVHQKIKDLIPIYKDRVTLHILDDLDQSQLFDKVAHLSDDSLVFLTIFQKDNAGEFIEYSEIAHQLSVHSKVPVYGLWDFYLGFGIVGGMLTSGVAQGQSAGILSARILAGESAESIGVIMISPNRYRFDYRQTNRFGVDLAQLPSGATVINEPPSLYTFSKELVWTVAIGGFLVTLVAILLGVNIHRRHSAELALRESDAKYTTLVDNLNVGVYRNSAEQDGKILQANPAMVNIFGYASLDEFRLVSAQNLYQNPEERVLFLDELTSNGFLKDRELLMKKKDGTPIWVLCNVTAVFDDNGKLKWVDGVNEDITEKKQLEAQLLQAQKMEAIGTLAGGVAHDFNNMLGGIMGAAEILAPYLPDDPEAKKFHQMILDTAGRAADLVGKLLTFSRSTPQALSTVDVSEIIKETILLLENTIDRRINLEVDLAANPTTVVGDPSQLQNAFLNLGINSSHAMSEGGTLRISSQNLELDTPYCNASPFNLHPGNYLEIEIHDTGCGIPPEHLNKIFDPFFTTKEQGQGTGLGLATVYGTVQQHKGSINVYSEPESGTTFQILLPLASKDQIIEIVSPPIIKGSGRILVVDDDEVMRTTAQTILEDLGYEVILAEDGQKALTIFLEKTGGIDLVLLDMMMPVMNGRACFKAMKQHDPEVRVILSSGFIREADVLEMKLGGLKGVIRKPYLRAKLSQVVHEALN